MPLTAAGQAFQSHNGARTIASQDVAIAAPIASLMDALLHASANIVIKAHSPLASDWLSEARLEHTVGQSLMGPTEVEITSPAPALRFLALRFPPNETGKIGWLEIHSLCQFFTRQLTEAWTSEFGIEPAFTITPIAPLTNIDNVQENIAELNSLLEILVNAQLTPQFQPIVSLRDGRVMGYETLIRGPKGGVLRRPGQMFRVADKARVVAWFDLACLEECLKAAAEQQIRHLLFINMDAEGLSAMAMQERPIAFRVRERGLSPANVVIEITERQMVDDFPRLMEEIAQLREQGFRIAIDDAGAGYSSLRSVAELKPDFVKIDRDLVKNVDVAGERRALLRSVADFARGTGTSVVAEGAETREELTVLIDLGIPFCQGYVLGKPSDLLRGTPREMREFVQERVEIRERRAAGTEVTAGMIARPGALFEGPTPLSEAARRFAKDPGLTSIAVREEGRITGLLVRQQFDHALALAKAAQAAALMPDAPVRQWMRTDTLRVQDSATVREVVEQVVTQTDLSLDADIIVLGPGGTFRGVVSARSLMEAAANQPVRRNLYSDPLTGLPGRVPLERELSARLDSQRSLGVIRIDLAHLADVNDAFGLGRGDALIIALAELIEAAAKSHGGPNDLIAHLGGDDFVILTGTEQAQGICRAVLEAFEKIAPTVATTQEDRNAASGSPRPPICALSIAAVTNRARRLQTLEQVMGTIHELMRGLRTQGGSRFAVDAVSGRM